jgi:hypothetical protein
MARLTFHVAQADRRDFTRHLPSQRARGLVHRAVAAAFSSPVAFVASSLLLVGAVSALQQTTPPADVIRGRDVLVFQDISGSMANTERRMLDELEPLKSYGVDIHQAIGVEGFGVKHDGTENFLHVLERAIDGSKADAVYLFSDFDPFTPEWDFDDDAGFERLRQILSEHHLRLYLRSVRKQPALRLLSIAHESGGDFIGGP